MERHYNYLSHLPICFHYQQYSHCILPPQHPPMIKSQNCNAMTYGFSRRCSVLSHKLSNDLHINGKTYWARRKHYCFISCKKHYKCLKYCTTRQKAPKYETQSKTSKFMHSIKIFKPLFELVLHHRKRGSLANKIY